MQGGPKLPLQRKHQIDLIFAPHYRGNKRIEKSQIKPRPVRKAWLFVQPLATVPFLTFSAQLQITFGRTPNHNPFAP
jgi:hypothetical protein